MRAGPIDLLDLELPIVLHPAVRVSDDALRRFSEQNKPYKIERNRDGDITIMTPVGGIGGTHENYITLKFGTWVDDDGTGIAFGPNTGFNLKDGSCLSPDAAWMSLSRWNALTHQEQEGYPPLCPEFLIEVRSRSDARRMVEAKMQSWIDNGAQLAWLIDPIAGVVSIYAPGRPVETLKHPEVVIATEPVAGFALVCTPLWSARS